MISENAGVLAVTVPLVMANARGLLEAGRLRLRSGKILFDLGAVVEADSSALAVMLGLTRSAQAMGASVQFSNVPAGVMSLAGLYGVAELIQVV